MVNDEKKDEKSSFLEEKKIILDSRKTY